MNQDEQRQTALDLWALMVSHQMRVTFKTAQKYAENSDPTAYPALMQLAVTFDEVHREIREEMYKRITTVTTDGDSELPKKG